ncbi:hypothetical protein HMPREF0379_0911 [[Eubacterium] yurii subsp. margaretiae ATCC 43715]|nr:hypothetical protein HMPREF0379_0911 [[Eubacterium] yurii subsp. margaretiae ATCC 43715]
MFLVDYRINKDVEEYFKKRIGTTLKLLKIKIYMRRLVAILI